MITVESKDNTIFITGEIDQDTKFQDHLKQVGNPCVVDLSGVQKINSTGVKNWINFWDSRAKAGIRLIFRNCSVAIVEQLNMVRAFTCGGSVETFQAPYICNECDHEWLVNFKTADVGGGLPAQKCPKCQSDNTELDELEDEYLAFAQKS